MISTNGSGNGSIVPTTDCKKIPDKEGDKLFCSISNNKSAKEEIALELCIFCVSWKILTGDRETVCSNPHVPMALKT